MEVLGTAMVAMRDALDARITLEVAVVRLTHPEVDDDSGALLDRIERLERKVQELTGAVGSATTSSTTAPTATGNGAPALWPGKCRARPAGAGSVGAWSVGARSWPGRRSAVATCPRGFRPKYRESPALHRWSCAHRAIARSGDRRDGPCAEPGSELPPPTRDELTEAWGDHVLSQLRAIPRGRCSRWADFSPTTAIPPFSRCRTRPMSSGPRRTRPRWPMRSASISAGLSGLRLVAELDAPPPPKLVSDASGSRPARQQDRGTDSAPSSSGDAESRKLTGPAERPGLAAEKPDQDSEVLDPDELDPLGEQVPGDALAWAQERLMQVFPGAEEV